MTAKKIRMKMKIKTQMNNKKSHSHQWPRQKKVKNLNPKPVKRLNRANPVKPRKRKSN